MWSTMHGQPARASESQLSHTWSVASPVDQVFHQNADALYQDESDPAGHLRVVRTGARAAAKQLARAADLAAISCGEKTADQVNRHNALAAQIAGHYRPT